MKRWLIFGAVVASLILVLAGAKGFGIFKMIQGFKAQGQPQFTVSTVKAAYTDWQPALSAVGSLRAERGVDLSSEVEGIVDSINFKSGDTVKAGAVVMRLRHEDERAHLESLRATAKLAQITYTRDQTQFQAQAISQAQIDSDLGTLNSLNAQVNEQEALIAKKTVRAPFGGQLGIRQVDEGQYLAAGTKVVTLQELDTLYVDFTLPQNVLNLLALGEKVDATVDAYPDRKFSGKLIALDPRVDPDTRNVSLRAALSNRDHKLLPGLFANVRVEAGTVQRYITLPQTAITYNPYGVTAFVVEHDKDKTPAGANGIAQQRIVKTGDTRGDQVAILDGIAEGDEVIVAGQMKLRNGVPLKINNDQPVANDPDPKPKDQ